MKVRVPVQIRFRDLDALGHVNNAVYLSYLELARVEYWRRVVRSLEFGFLLARVECDFKAPVELDTPLEVGLRVSGFGRTSFTFEYELARTDTGAVVAAARTVQVCVGADGRPVPVPTELRERVQEFEG